MYWYVVVSGTLEMFNVDSRHDKKVREGAEREREKMEALKYEENMVFYVEKVAGMARSQPVVNLHLSGFSPSLFLLVS